MEQKNDSFETRFPVKEKLATDVTTLISWLAEEMGYSRDKTRGYEEKLTRLGRSPEDALSVFGFMGGYWHRFRQADGVLAELADQTCADRCLQALAKVVTGLCDKVALAMWCGQKQTKTGQTKVGLLVLEALELVNDEVNRQPNRYSSKQLKQFIESPEFGGNPMGQAVLGLHRNLADQPENFSKLRETALNGAGGGLLMLQHYGSGLKTAGLSVRMPRPGLGSGDIRPW